jgi:hypothetical protein
MKKIIFVLAALWCCTGVAQAQILPGHRHNKAIKAEKEKGFDIVPFDGEYPTHKRSALTPQSITNWGEQLLLPAAIKARIANECTYTVTVKVMDTGYSNHSQLNGQLAPSNYTTDPKPTDSLSGHGTHVTGIIGAKDFGLAAALGNKLRIKSVKVLNDQGSGQFAWIANAIRTEDVDNKQRLARNEFVVCNLSLGGGTAVFADVEAALKASTEAGVIYAAASGNDGVEGVIYPARSQYCIAVGAIGTNQRRASFSNIGIELYLAMPGVGIKSTHLNNTYADLSGTSMATPFTTAAMAIGLSKYGPALANTAKMRAYMKWIASDILPPTGFDKDTGFGIAFIKAILDNNPANMPTTNPPAVVLKKMRIGISLNRSFFWQWSGQTTKYSATVKDVEFELEYPVGKFDATHDAVAISARNFFNGRNLTLATGQDQFELMKSLASFLELTCKPSNGGNVTFKRIEITTQSRNLIWQP